MSYIMCVYIFHILCGRGVLHHVCIYISNIVWTWCLTSYVCIYFKYCVDVVYCTCIKMMLHKPILLFVDYKVKNGRLPLKFPLISNIVNCLSGCILFFYLVDNFNTITCRCMHS